jgi:hypothetical protein
MYHRMAKILLRITRSRQVGSVDGGLLFGADGTAGSIAYRLLSPPAIPERAV